ncbi:MAG: AAA family ATPase [Oscillibacter sp.]|nr:AAA family ATPase [Oscillibacter sp.]
MNIRDAKQEIKNALRAYFRKDGAGQYILPSVHQRPLLLMGPPGIGKTAVVEQAAQEAGVGLVSYTMTHHTRQSAIGLPRIETRTYQGRTVNVTEYTLSEIVSSIYDCMERTGKREGILFLDEINCVSETLAPTILQFLQNKTFGNHRIPEGWLIVAAGNPPGYNRSVREFDVVTLDRVRRIDVEPELEAWMDYARRKHLHGAVLAYLSIRTDRFYRVEQTAGGASFVTARGWEDLSALMQSCEVLDISVSEAQVRQYLQNEDTARDFAGYYRLYRKYGEAYDIPGILDGTAVDAASCAARAQNASFDERFTVVNLILDYLGGQFARYGRMDRSVTALHQTLETFKLFMRDKSDMGCLDEFIRNRRNAMRVKQGAGLLPPEERDTGMWVMERLEEYALAMKAENIRSREQVMERIRVLFYKETSSRKELVQEVKDRLNRAFAFLADCFGNGQEMILFVSALTRMDQAMDFISLHGCGPYLEYSQKLLYQEREQALRDACTEILQ